MNRWINNRGVRSNRVPLLPGEWRPEATMWAREEKRKMVVTLLITAIVATVVIVFWQTLIVSPHDKFMMDTYGQVDHRDLWSVEITNRDWDE